MYRLKLTTFLEWVCLGCYFDKNDALIKQSIINNGTFVVDPWAVLKSMNMIPSKLIDEDVTERFVKGSDCILY